MVAIFWKLLEKIIQVGNTSRKISFEARKIISSSYDANQNSACDVLKSPIIVATAIGTSVVTKEKQRPNS